MRTKEDTSGTSLLSETFAVSLGKASTWLSLMLQCEIVDTERLEQFRKNVIDGLLAGHVEHEKKAAQPINAEDIGAVEAAAKFEPIRGQLPASIGDTALFDDAVAPLNARHEGSTPDPVAPAAPAPTRRKKAKASA